ncbi:MAG: diguanylate cyclase (GGDEF)-like protein [Pseudohongiellaceae bacterium]|jgi:diguanylate cyclase (GGDEF)-like protein
MAPSQAGNRQGLVMPVESGNKAQQPNANLPHDAIKLDPLTGFHQQDYLDEVLNKNIQGHSHAPAAVSLALLQLENFYEIKTWLGKSDATLFLSDIARLLKKTLPSSVLLSRCKHYEFAALLFDQSSRDGKQIAAKVRCVIESAAEKSLPDRVKLKISIGIAEIDDRTTGKEVLYARARHDMSVYRKGQVHLPRQQQNLQPAAVFKRLKIALEAGLLLPLFQAVVSLKPDELEHYEIRTHVEDSQGVIPAELLFEVAVQNAWGEAIDRWLIQNALKILKQLANPALKLIINITHNSIVSPHFFPWLDAVLAKSPNLGTSLVFQVSEIDVLIAQHHISYFCQQLTNHNIQLCISHFGCTDDPFRYLDLFRAEFVKLNGPAIRHSVIEKAGTEGIPKLVERLHDNGLRVIVPNVENMTQMPQLWSSNVNYVQGYGLHRPSKSLNYEFLQEATLSIN